MQCKVHVCILHASAAQIRPSLLSLSVDSTRQRLGRETKFHTAPFLRRVRVFAESPSVKIVFSLLFSPLLRLVLAPVLSPNDAYK